MRKVIIEEEVMNSFLNIQRSHDFRKEIGGIIIGKLDSKRMCLSITDISFPFSNDKSFRFRFIRNSEGHQQEMDTIWEQSNHKKSYLGEWHTHDQDCPVPSIIDKRTWIRISKQDHNFDQCCFIIVGHKELGLWIATDGEIIKQDGV